MTLSEIQNYLLRNRIPAHMDLISPYEEEGFDAGYEELDVDKDVLEDTVEKTIDTLQTLCGSKRKFDKDLREGLKVRILELYDTGYQDGTAFRV